MNDVSRSSSVIPKLPVRIAIASPIIADASALASDVVSLVNDAVIENEAVSGFIETSALPETEIVGVYPSPSAADSGIARIRTAIADSIAFLMLISLPLILLHLRIPFEESL